MTTMHLGVRLDARHLSALEDIRNALATALLPEVSLSNAIRAAIITAHKAICGDVVITGEGR